MTAAPDTRDPSRPPADPADIAHVIAPPPLIYLVPLTVALLVHGWRPWPVLPGRWPHLVGPLFIAASLVFVLPALGAFARARTNPKPWKPTTALVIEGPYRYTRNPMYLGFTLLFVGVTCWVNSVWPLFALLVVLPAMQVGVIQREERYLERKFGAPYREYMQMVRRWI
ncbi:MAG: isoprenylcysteine carboxylmethyltransferase family protein [Gemmatimonadota bacterium]